MNNSLTVNKTGHPTHASFFGAAKSRPSLPKEEVTSWINFAMKTTSGALFSVLLGLTTLSSALDQPKGHVRRLKNDKNDKNDENDKNEPNWAFWEPGFCESQLDQCNSQIEQQENQYPWIQMQEILARVDADDDSPIASLSKSIANLSTIDYSTIPSELEAATGSDNTDAILALQQATEALTEMDKQGALNIPGVFPDISFQPILDAIALALSSMVAIASGSLQSIFFELQEFSQFLRLTFSGPIFVFGLASVVARAMLPVLNSALSVLTGRDVNLTYFCPSQLVGCSLEALTRFMVITIGGTVLALAPGGG